MTFLQRLCELGSAATVELRPDGRRLRQTFGRDAGEALEQILSIKNGFYGFDGSLHVFSDAGTREEPSIYRWNDTYCWKIYYGALAPDGVCFAEEIYGDQFLCLDDGEIGLFDAESGNVERIASNWEQWAEQVFVEPAVWTGCRTAREWQAANGRIPAGHRLLPRVPRTPHRDIPIASLEVVEAVEGMQTRGARARALYAGGRLS